MPPELSSPAAFRPAVFLDRDGVLISTFVREGVPHPPRTLDELRILPGVPQALAILAAEGFALFMVTNQPDVARGDQTRDVVESMNRTLQSTLPLEAVYVCYHDNADRCHCRKPRPGMLIDAARSHRIDLNASYMVGDRWSDVAAGLAAGCRTLLIDRPYSQPDRCKPHWKVDDLTEAARVILNQGRRPFARVG